MRNRRTDILNKQRKSTRGGAAVVCDAGSRLARANISLGIISPMGNEADSAVPLVRETLDRCGELKAVNFYAVLDRVSGDGTRELLSDYAVREPRLRVVWAPENRCIVDAYVRGYKEALLAGHDYILEMDAGFSHRPEDIPKFLDAVEEGYDCVFGSRFVPGGAIANVSFRRWLFSRGGSVLTNALVGTRLADMTSGFELFSRNSLQMVLERGIQSRAHFFQTEIKYYCRDLKIAEVPITYSTDGVTVSNAALGDAFRNLWRLCKLRWMGRP
jgi:dolichol-phosphate mannosyltransferase